MNGPTSWTRSNTQPASQPPQLSVPLQPSELLLIGRAGATVLKRQRFGEQIVLVEEGPDDVAGEDFGVDALGRQGLRELALHGRGLGRGQLVAVRATVRAAGTDGCTTWRMGPTEFTIDEPAGLLMKAASGSSLPPPLGSSASAST